MSPPAAYEQPVVFDVDDFSDKWPCLHSLFRLKDRYSNFKATVFTIADRVSDKLLLPMLQNSDWIQLGIHGFTHEPNDELIHYSADDLIDLLSQIPKAIYAPIVRPPGWHVNADLIEACNILGLSVALHATNEALAKTARWGHYLCPPKDRPYWHGHTHDVCDNWIDQKLPALLERWPLDEKFCFVTEALICE